MVLLRMLTFRPVTSVQSLTANSVPASNTVKSVTTSTPKAKLPAKIAGGEWGDIIQKLGLNGFIKQLANNCELKKHEGNSWHLNLHPQYEAILTKNSKKSLEGLLAKHYGTSQTVNIRIEQAETPAMQQQQVQEEHQRYMTKELEKEPFIVYMQENCDAQVKVMKNG